MVGFPLVFNNHTAFQRCLVLKFRLKMGRILTGFKGLGFINYEIYFLNCYSVKLGPEKCEQY